MTGIVALFDIDGVCVHPGGYRAAVHDSLTYFLDRFRLSHHIPHPETPAIYESIGITSEWDMISLTLAIIFEAIAERSPEPFSAVTSLQMNPLDTWAGDLQVNLEPKILSLANFLQKGMAPADSIYQVCCSNPTESPFPGLSQTSIIHPLIGSTRNISLSETTRYFQNLVLGSDIFGEVYGLASPVPTESYLKLYDKPVLNLQNKQKIQTLVQQKVLGISFITARPSYQPKEINQRIDGNTPEAEMAVDLLGLSTYPLIGYGRLRYLASVLNLDVESMLKPSPIQALGAIASAITFKEWDSLLWAERLVNSRGTASENSLEWMNSWFPDHLELHIFEDSLVGIQAVKTAAEMLQQLGKKINLHAWGIATNPIKVNALKNQGAEVVGNVNIAIDQALSFS